jgi:hypothetical protein
MSLKETGAPSKGTCCYSRGQEVVCNMEGTKTELISTTVRPQFIYCCATSKLLRANLLTGEGSSLKCLITSSRMAVVGVSCLEEVCSSLVVV